MLVPFRLPNIATRDVVKRFGHALRRAVLDRAFGPDIDQVLNDQASAETERRLYAHIASHLPYYSATIIAAGDPAERFFALAKLKDPQGRPLTDGDDRGRVRSEEHTSELQSPDHLVCRLLLEK